MAVIRVSDYASTWDWHAFYQEAGLEYRPQWGQLVGRCDPSVVQTPMPLLMDYPADERPQTMTADGQAARCVNGHDAAPSGVTSSCW